MLDFIVNDDVIPQELALELNKKWKYNRFRFYWKSHTNKDFYHWHQDIVSGQLGTKADHISELDPNSPEFKVWELIQGKLTGRAKLLRYYVNGYTFGTEGHPHRDCAADDFLEYTVITYLNEEWKPEWGGETVVFNEMCDNVDFACLPKLGRVMLFPSYRLHAGRSVSRLFPGLRMVLVCKILPLN